MLCACGGIDLDEMPRVINPECGVHGRVKVVPPPGPDGPTPEQKARAERQEVLDLIVSCAKDVVDYWPNLSFRTIRIMIPKMQALKEALQMLK